MASSASSENIHEMPSDDGSPRFDQLEVTILFVDLRGFTALSASMLSDYRQVGYAEA